MFSSHIYNENYFGFVYIWFDRVRKRFYIGSHMGAVDDGYICSSKHMKAAYLKRPSSFMRRIIYWHPVNDRQTLLFEEKRWLQMISVEEMKSKKYYNKTRNAWGENPGAISKTSKENWAEKKTDPEFMAKLSDQRSTQAKLQWETKRDKMMASPVGGRGRKKPTETAEHRAKKSASAQKRWDDPEYKARVTASLNTDEYRTKRSQLAKDQWNDTEARELCGKRSLERWSDKTDEQKQANIEAMVAANRGRKWFTNGTDNMKVKPELAPDGWLPGRSGMSEKAKNKRYQTVPLTQSN